MLSGVCLLLAGTHSASAQLADKAVLTLAAAQKIAAAAEAHAVANHYRQLGASGASPVQDGESVTLGAATLPSCRETLATSVDRREV